MIKYIVALLSGLLLVSCVKGVKNETVNSAVQVLKDSYPQDNVIEEMIEAKIEQVTGVDVDLSPSTPESWIDISIDIEGEFLIISLTFEF